MTDAQVISARPEDVLNANRANPAEVRPARSRAARTAQAVCTTVLESLTGFFFQSLGCEVGDLVDLEHVNEAAVLDALRTRCAFLVYRTLSDAARGSTEEEEAQTAIRNRSCSEHLNWEAKDSWPVTWRYQLDLIYTFCRPLLITVLIRLCQSYESVLGLE